MGNGRWTRFGRAACEGYNLSFGDQLRFSVIAAGHSGPDPKRWHVSLNSMDLGSFETFEAAVARVEHEARSAMTMTIEDWERYLAAPKPKRRVGRSRR